MSNQPRAKGIVQEALANVFYYLSPADKRKSVWMFILLILGSLMDVFGLASLVPVIMAASKPGSIFKSSATLWLYNSLGFTSEKSFLIFLIVGVLIFFIAKNIYVTFINYQQVKFTAHIALKIVKNQLDKHLNMPFGEFSKLGSPHLLHCTIGVPNTFVASIIRQLYALFSDGLVIGIIVLGILIYQPTLFVILGVVLGLTMYLTYRGLQHRSTAVGNQIDALKPVSIGLLTDAFIGFIELKLAGKQEQFRRQILQKQEEIQDLEAVSYLFTLLPLKFIEMAAIIAVVTIYLYSLLFASNPENLVMIIGLFAAAAYRLMPSVNRCILALVSLRQHRFTFDSLASSREYAEETLPSQQPLRFSQEIVFDNLSFSFGESAKPVLNNVSFRVKKGEKIGLIGSSGSGKTTLMNILLRFYQEQQGHILVDGQPLSDENLQAWYKLVGYVKQDTFLMDTSIKDNITLNDEVADEERLQYAIDQASLRGFINSLPDGVNTQIGERGSRLSGGQRQRIGIARAIYKRTEVLIMDEATSALDNETEREVNEAIRQLAHTDITLFIIAHRITTLRDCNRIYELKDGRLHAEYQYEELIDKTMSLESAHTDSKA
ncbi:ABC transporter ATP-binding protein [Hymenobacter sp. BT491]|uniref:ABC transporter ATP-binding protein n=1 Tax=Hymenobacter sp. BT491 TaxID=2766779 RepID=UPI0016537B73|nr:ABC transporter ATP-binding protein [Hymenobacter sp. BT491]MBC6988296.1 ABC transporter ATP-binding protein [Hymenobacter sp. BT491]